MIGRTFGHFRIQQKLGAGGMGVVYSARDLRLDRDVAIKFLPQHIAASPETLERFRIEARAAAALNHPNVATIHAIEEFEGETFLVMELLEGRELRDRIGQGRLSLAEAIDLATQIAEGLAAAHDRGVIHRDIKASNIMVTTGQRVKIMDFGLARIGAGADLTRSGTTMGTVAYMSPEQVRGETLDLRTDMWSFGVVLYEMLSGARPFVGEYERAVLHAIQHDEPAAIDDVPPALARIVERALKKDRDDRYASMHDLIRELKVATKPARSANPADASKLHSSSLAVLPFTSVRKDPDSEYLGFALADQIIGTLGYVNGLQVRPSSSVRKYQGQSVDAQSAALDLQVEYMLTGHYLVERGAIRLNVELVEVSSDQMIWRESIRSSVDDVFALQDLAAEKVLAGLELRFSEVERQNMHADVPGNPVAYEYYLRAVGYSMDLEDNRRALEMLEQSVALDPNYAPAHLELGYRLKQMAGYHFAGRTYSVQAHESYGRALKLNPNSPWALRLLSMTEVDRGHHEIALEHVERLFALSPDDATVHFARSYIYRYTGMLDEAIEAAKQALRLDPKNPRFRSIVLLYFFSGDHRRALECCELDPASHWSGAWRGACHYMLGAREQALICVERVVAAEPRSFLGLRCAALRAVALGDPESGRSHVRQLEALMTDGIEDSEHWYLIAQSYALTGDVENCIHALSLAIEGGFYSYHAFLRDAAFDSVRNEREFQELLQIAKQKHEAFVRFVAARQGKSAPTSGAERTIPIARNSFAASAAPELRYCQTVDGASIAYSVHGSGPALIRSLGWFTHLEMEWQWPALRLMWERLAEKHTLVRYDGRGIGLSDPWNDEFTEETRQCDLDAVVNALGREKVAIYGISEGGWTAAHYAAANPERVERLIIYGSYLRGAAHRPGYDADEEAALLTLVRKGWGRDTTEIRQILAKRYFGNDPDPAQVTYFNALHGAAFDAATAARYEESLNRRGLARDLFASIRTPTLVIHCREDKIIPFEEGKLIASVIPDARFLPLPTQSHYFPTDDAVTHQIVDAIDRFL